MKFAATKGGNESSFQHKKAVSVNKSSDALHNILGVLLGRESLE